MLQKVEIKEQQKINKLKPSKLGYEIASRYTQTETEAKKCQKFTLKFKDHKFKDNNWT